MLKALRKSDARGRAIAAGIAAVGVTALVAWEWSARDPVDYGELAASLDYVDRNYAEAVGPRDGVANVREYREQRALLERALEISEQLGWWDRAARAPIAAAAEGGMNAAGSEEVLPRVEEALAALKRHHDLGWEPKAHPSWQRGKELFGEACAVCHGADGSGMAPAALSTQPPDLRDPSAVARLSPVSVFGVVSYGIPETAMPGFAAAYSVDERWDVAFYLMTLSHPAEINPAYRYPELKPWSLAELARDNDRELTNALNNHGAVGSRAYTQLEYLRAIAPFVDR